MRIIDVIGFSKAKTYFNGERKKKREEEEMLAKEYKKHAASLMWEQAIKAGSGRG